MVVEKMADGLHIMDNPIGVLANSPDFKWQMTNLRNYIGTAVTQQQEAEWDSVKLTPLDRAPGRQACLVILHLQPDLSERPFKKVIRPFRQTEKRRLSLAFILWKM